MNCNHYVSFPMGIIVLLLIGLMFGISFTYGQVKNPFVGLFGMIISIILVIPLFELGQYLDYILRLAIK